MNHTLKSLERFVRRGFLAATDRPFAGDLVSTPRLALELGRAPRVLFLRQDRIGDVLVSVPVVRAVRQQFPEARLDMLFSRTNYGARESLRAYLDRAWRYDKTPLSAIRVIRALRREHFDAVVDLMDNPSTSAQLAATWSGARYRIGIRHHRAGHYTHAVPLLDRQRDHIVERMAQLLLPFGIDPRTVPLDLEYALSEADRERARERIGPRSRPLVFGVNISGASRARYWGVNNFVALLRWIRSVDPRFEFRVGGSPAYAADVGAIATAVGTGAQAVPPLASFHEYAAVVREFDMLLTPDTSVLHLGAAWKIPTVVMFHQPAGAPLPWYPYRTPSRSVLHPDGVDRISVADVQEAWASLAAERFAEVR